MICTELDQYAQDYQELYPSWVVWLNNGTTVFQDDNRPGVEPHSAWNRLHSHCLYTGEYITSMQIKFRSNAYMLPQNADGYYFSKGVRAGFSNTKTLQLFFVGILNQGVLNVTCWKVPEMMKEKTEEREVDENNICLIRNKNIPLT